MSSTTGSTSHTKNDLSGSQDTYKFRVKAISSVGSSADSSDYSVTTTEEPDAPSTFTTVAESTSSITISWTEPTEDGGSAITDYEIDWNQGSQTDSWINLSLTTGG